MPWSQENFLCRWFDEDVIGLGFAQREVIAANFDLERVTHRRRADQG
jgi:hypothetical protein